VYIGYTLVFLEYFCKRCDKAINYTACCAYVAFL